MITGGKMKKILLSLHQEWWEKMLTGEKDIEVRKTAPQEKLCKEYWVLVYVTGGVGVVGEFTCRHFHSIRVTPTIQKTIGLQGWDLESHSCLTARHLHEYARGRLKPLWGWQVEHVKAYPEPKQLSDYGVKRPPQSWMYLK
jgi:predicted transcriptional regulator